MTELPDFSEPPVAEVAVGVQFRPLPELRGLKLAPLREQWLLDYPQDEEQPPLPPAIESGSPLSTSIFQLSFQSAPRYWFKNEPGTELIQVQSDRFIVNWRESSPPVKYPRFPAMRSLFVRRSEEFSTFCEESRIGEVSVTQAELNYINVIDVEDGNFGDIRRFFKPWNGFQGHHLGEPEQARLALSFAIPDLAPNLARLHVSIDPAQRSNGSSAIFMSLIVRGKPASSSLSSSIEFLDEAHSHLVRSFAELTTEEMQSNWGRKL